MTKIRKTKKQKIASEKRKQNSNLFSVKDEWLKTDKPEKETSVMAPAEKRYFKIDLTKTFFLTMLVLALELALWRYLGH